MFSHSTHCRRFVIRTPRREVPSRVRKDGLHGRRRPTLWLEPLLVIGVWRLGRWRSLYVE
jgi:hypothetical protein